jgi:hypothetical protein
MQWGVADAMERGVRGGGDESGGCKRGAEGEEGREQDDRARRGERAAKGAVRRAVGLVAALGVAAIAAIVAAVVSRSDVAGGATRRGTPAVTEMPQASAVAGARRARSSWSGCWPISRGTRRRRRALSPAISRG